MKNLRRKVLAATLAAAMSVPTFAFAGTTTNTTTAVATTANTAITLTLDNAFAALKDSPQMSTIEIQYLADRGAVSGYAETASKIKQNAEILGDSTGQLAAEIGRDFSNTMTLPNKQARLNALNVSLTETYYGVKNVETLAKIAKENLDITQTTYDQTALKYKLGKVSKLDLLNAESELSKAKNKYQEAADGLAQAKMGFNLFMGYDLLQEVKLTSEVTEVAKPTITLEDAIKQAMENRLDIKGAEYQLKMAKASASNYRAYPSTSATYLKGASMVLAAETAQKLAAPKAEMDVRTKYMKMNETYNAVQTAKMSVSNSKEILRLSQLQYNNGLCTLKTVQEAQLAYIAAENEQASALLDYNLAVQAFTYSYGYGVEAAAL